MSQTLLRIENLRVDYKTDLETVHAVNGVSFSLCRGQTIGLVGETGAGKTTTALSILGLLPERTARIGGGVIDFDGQDLLKLTGKEMQKVRGKQIAMIFQDPMTALNPVLTVGEQIAESLQAHNEDKMSRAQIENRVEEVMEMVGIMPSRKGEYPHQFSGGMKQRVVIAMALACNPRLLIADEPTTALDVTIQAQVLAMMMELRDTLGTAMIMITHDLGIVAQTCDKVGVMYAGEIIEYGSLEDIFTGEDHHPYTVGLFNSIPDLEKDERRLHPIDGMMPDPTELPEGCAFSPRCPYCTEACTKKHPELYGQGEHQIRCIRFAGSQEV